MGTWETIETGRREDARMGRGRPGPGDAGRHRPSRLVGPERGRPGVRGTDRRRGVRGPRARPLPRRHRGHDRGAEELAGRLDETAADAIALATIDALADRLGPEAPLATIGFSLGAAWSIWSAAERDRVAGSVVYYGTVLGPSLARAHVPVLGHFAESDPFEPAEQVAAFEEALRAAGRSAEIHRYPGTGHWFAEPSRDAYRPAAADLAFERTVDFLRRVTAPAA